MQLLQRTNRWHHCFSCGGARKSLASRPRATPHESRGSRLSSLARISSIMECFPRFKEDINDFEKPWLALHPLLAADGYILRDRYNPNWRPEPSATKRTFSLRNSRLQSVPWTNRVRLRHIRLMDATRAADGLQVMIKAIDLNRSVRHHEWYMTRIFTRPDIVANPRNHCIAAIDYLRYPGTQWELLVTPKMVPFDVTPFETFREVVDFFRQILEGVIFMHELNFTHRDIGPTNVVMFAPDLFPHGTSTLFPGYETDLISPKSRHRARREVYVRYYLIDFGLSWTFESEAARQPLDIVRGQFKDVPEYTSNTQCDGFALDVWCVGKLIQEEFIPNYRLPIFMVDFADYLTNPNPVDRPTATAALSAFNSGIEDLGEDMMDLTLAVGRSPLSLLKPLLQAWKSEAELPLSVPLDSPAPIFTPTPNLRSRR